MTPQQVLVVSDSALKLSRKWYYSEVVERFKEREVHITVATYVGGSLRDLKATMQRELEQGQFDTIVVICLGSKVQLDLIGAVDEIVPFLLLAPRSPVGSRLQSNFYLFFNDTE